MNKELEMISQELILRYYTSFLETPLSKLDVTDERFIYALYSCLKDDEYFDEDLIKDMNLIEEIKKDYINKFNESPNESLYEQILKILE